MASKPTISREDSLQGAWRLAQERAVRVIELEGQIRRLEEQNEEAVDRWIAAQADAAHAEVRIEELEEQNAVLVEQYEAMDRSRAIVYRELTARVMELEEQHEALTQRLEREQRAADAESEELSLQINRLKEQLEASQEALSWALDVLELSLRRIDEFDHFDQEHYAIRKAGLAKARAALNPASSSSDLLDKDYEVDATAQNQESGRDK